MIYLTKAKYGYNHLLSITTYILIKKAFNTIILICLIQLSQCDTIDKKKSK